MTDQYCAVCGRDVRGLPGSIHRYDPNTGESTFFCPEHNPKPLTAEQRAERDRLDVEAGLAVMRGEVELMRQLVSDSQRPVSPIDRDNLVHLLLRLFDRTLWLMNEVRALKGQEPIPDRMQWPRS